MNSLLKKLKLFYYRYRVTELNIQRAMGNLSLPEYEYLFSKYEIKVRNLNYKNNTHEVRKSDKDRKVPNRRGDS